MAEIPVGNFGYREAAPAQHTVIQSSGNSAINEAIHRSAGTFGAMAKEQQDENAREKAAMEQADAANKIGQAKLQVATAQQSILDQMREGKLSYDQASKAYDDAVNAVQFPEYTGSDPVLKARYDGSLSQLKQGGQLELMPHIEQAKIGKFQSDIDGILDSQSKQAGLPGADVEAINAQVSAMDEQGRMAYGDKWEAKKREFVEGNYQNHVQQRLMEAGDNLGALRSIEHDLAAADGYYADKLDAGKRLALQNNISGNISRIEQHNEMLSMKREIRAQNALQDIEKQNASGIPPTPAMVENWKKIAEGTESAGRVDSMIQQGNKVQEFLRVPIEQQQSIIQTLESNLTTNGGSVDDKTNLNALKNVFDANKKKLEETPLLYAQDRLGDKVVPVDFGTMMVPGHEAEMASALSDRMHTVQALQGKHGKQVQTNILLPQEVEALKTKLGSSTPDQQRQFFGGLIKATGGGDAYKSMMRQIAPDQPVKAFAGMIADKSNSVTIDKGFFSGETKAGSADVSATMLQGEALLNPPKDAQDGKGKFPMPEDKEFANVFNDYAGEAFTNSPNAYQTASQAVKAYYAGKSAQNGDVSGVVNPDLMKESVRAVLGVPVEHNGKKVLAPWGMDETTFTDKAEAAYKASGLSVDFEDINLVPAGDGRYGVVSGKTPILKNGKPVIIEVR